MNEALIKCQAWAERYGLDISPEKTEYMICTSKLRKSYTIPAGGITLKGKQVDRVMSVKYLGLIIDHKLSWHEHINSRIEAARKNIFRLNTFIGKTWGPCPKLVKFAYTSSIRPMLSYAAFAFADRLTQGQKVKLKSF